MGCWNKTCGLTTLPIHCGEEVMVVPIVQSPYKDRCYSTALWHPVFLPFWAKYDDYGGGDNSTGSLLSSFIEYAKENLVEMEQGPNQYHDIAVKASDFTESSFYEAVHEGRLNFNGYQGRQQNVDFVMIRKDVIDKFKDRHVFEAYVGEGKGSVGYSKSYINYTWSDMISHIPEFVANVKAEMTAPEKYEGHAAMRVNYLRALNPTGEYGDKFKGANLVPSWLNLNSSSVRESALWEVRDTIALATVSDDNLAAEMVEDVLTLRFVNYLMSSMRKIWVPGCHEGSQGEELEVYAMLGDIYKERKAERAAEMGELYDDGDDD